MGRTQCLCKRSKRTYVHSFMCPSQLISRLSQSEIKNTKRLIIATLEECTETTGGMWACFGGVASWMLNGN